MTITFQSSGANTAGNNSDVSITLTGTEGNFQIVFLVHRSGSATSPSMDGSGWNTPTVGNGELYEDNIGDASNRRAIVVFYRTVPASAGATVTGRWGGFGSNPEKVMFGIEFSTDTSSPTWSKDNHATSTNDTTAGTSLASGSAAPTNSEAVTVYGLVTRHGAPDNEDSYSNSFTAGPGASPGEGSGDAAGFGGYKIATGTQTTTASWTTSAKASGMIVAVSVAGAGTGSLLPPSRPMRALIVR